MEKTFEETMKELKELVSLLESGTLELEKAVEAYQKGIELSKHAYELLKNAEAKITIED